MTLLAKAYARGYQTAHEKLAVSFNFGAADTAKSIGGGALAGMAGVAAHDYTDDEEHGLSDYLAGALGGGLAGGSLYGGNQIRKGYQDSSEALRRLGSR